MILHLICHLETSSLIMGRLIDPLRIPRVHMPYRDKISCSIERDSLDLYNFKANTRDKKLIIQQVSRMETWNTCFSEFKKKKTSYFWLSSFFNSLLLINKQKFPVTSAGKLTFQIALLPEDDNLIYCSLACFKSVKNIKHKF